MATLVHDDVLDAAPLRRGRPTVVARSGRDAGGAVGDLLFSRAFAELGGERRPSGRSSCWPAPRSRSPSASSPSAATPSTSSISAERYLRALRAEDRAAVRVRLPDRRRRGPRGRRRPAPLRDLRARDRARLPAPRRRPRRHRPARADRQGARHRPARRHRDPAADPRPRARRRRWPSSTCARSTPAAPRRSATGSPRPASSRRSAPAPAARVGAAKRALERSGRSSPSSASCWSWSPTGSSSATPERLPARSPRGGSGPPRGRRRSARPPPPCSPGSGVEVVEHRLGAAVERLVEAVDDLLAVDAAAVPLALGAAQVDVPAGARSPAPSRSGRRGPSRRTGRRAGRHRRRGVGSPARLEDAAARARARGRAARSGRASLSAALPLRMLLSAEHRRCFRYSTPGASAGASRGATRRRRAARNRLSPMVSQRPHDPGGDRGRPDRLDPYDEAMIQPSSVDVRVDRRFRVFHNARYPYIDVRQPMEDLTELVEVADDEPFILHPGEFVLGQTLERVRPARRHRRPARGQELARAARAADPQHRRVRRRRLRGQPDARALERRQPPDHDLLRDADRPDLVHAHGRPGRAPVRLGETGSKYQGQAEPTPSRFYLNFER